MAERGNSMAANAKSVFMRLMLIARLIDRLAVVTV
jgi:hypothetical protein